MSILARSIFPELRTAFRLLEDPFFGRSSALAPTTTSARVDTNNPWSSLLSTNYPALDVHEKDNAWEVEAEVPGARKEDIKVEYVFVWCSWQRVTFGLIFYVRRFGDDGQTLTVSGKVERFKEEGGGGRPAIEAAPSSSGEQQQQQVVKASDSSAERSPTSWSR
jgi:hypothetical protein